MITVPINRIPPKTHDLKIWSRYFQAVISGAKKAEHRINDRNFQVGDTLLLREVTEPKCEYTGRKVYVTITHIIRGGEMDILSIEPQDTVTFNKSVETGTCCENGYFGTPHNCKKQLNLDNAAQAILSDIKLYFCWEIEHDDKEHVAYIEKQLSHRWAKIVLKAAGISV